MTDIVTLTTPNVDEGLLEVLLAYKRVLTDQQISEMLMTIKPVIRRDGVLHYIETVDPKEVSFIWSPVISHEAVNLTVLTKIYTLHVYGCYGMFKPSIQEVLTMIPADMVSHVKAFEINGPEDADDLNRQWAAVDAGYHVAVTTLYA